MSVVLPPYQLFISFTCSRTCKEQETLKEEILKEIPEAEVEFVVGEDGKKE